MIRSDYIYLDVQDNIIALLKALQTGTARWTNWTIKKDYPKSFEFRQFADAKPIIFLERFEEVDQIESQFHVLGERSYGGDAVQDYGYESIMQARLGIWLHDKHGGPDEVQIIKSHLKYIFDPPKPGLPSTTYNITYSDATAFVATKLYTQGIHRIQISGGTEIAVEDQSEYREEMVLTVNALCGETIILPS